MCVMHLHNENGVAMGMQQAGLLPLSQGLADARCRVDLPHRRGYANPLFNEASGHTNKS
jgi:ribulose-5-phosphate 4-epimerase/fuculose-1-phosphate aldolase